MKVEEIEMSKIAVVYWSGTGNTQKMAEAVAEGVKAAGGEADVIFSDSFSANDVSNYDAFAFGCPAMGSENLEEGSFDPMFASIEGSLSGKKVGLFGSYGWGDQTWMHDWESRVQGDGAQLVEAGITCLNEPDDAALEACKELGGKLAA